MLVLAAACALFIAPFLTLVCRSTLAAAVFTIAIPGLLATGADIVGGLIYGLQNAAAIDHFKLVGLLARHVSDLRGVGGRRLADVPAPRSDRGPRRTSRFRTSCGQRNPADERPRDPRAGGTIPSRRSSERPAAAADRVRGRRIYVVSWAALAWMDRRAIDEPMRL